MQTPNPALRIFAWCCVVFLAARIAAAQSTITLAIDPSSPGRPIPDDFNGLSFETGSLHYNHYRTNAYFFDSSNGPLLTLFQNLGLGSIRIGGNSLDRGYVPAQTNIDALFRFAKAANVQVIYSLRLANGDPDQDASIAQYLRTHYRPWLNCLAIGNEPNSYNGLDSEITNQASFLAKWNRFAAAVTRAVPDVKLGGVDNGNGATTWASSFADAETGNSNVTCILAHYEPGGPARGKEPEQWLDEMLSPNNATRWNPSCYTKLGAMAQSHGLGFRFSEANSHVAPIKTDAGNHSFATALFALDFLHWWAAHGCLSVHFHTGMGGFNGAFTRGTNNDYDIYPICYGIAAFNLGGHGIATPLTVTNPDTLNLTAYAVTDKNHDLYVTLVNKEHGPTARTALVTLNLPCQTSSVIYLKAPNHDATATTGITLGDALITSRELWHPNWTALESHAQTERTLDLAPSSAVVVRLTR